VEDFRASGKRTAFERETGLKTLLDRDPREGKERGWFTRLQALAMTKGGVA